MEEFTRQPGKAKESYANANLKYLGSGSARKVFDIGNGNVLKIAQHEYGQSQIKNEVEVCNRWCKTGLFATIFDYDKENYDWLIMEKVNTFSNSEFKSTFGLDGDSLWEFYDSIVENNSSSVAMAIENCLADPENLYFEKQYPNITDLGQKLLEVFFTLVSKYGVDDISREDHFGLTEKGRIVVLDYGHSDEKLLEFNAIGAGQIVGVTQVLGKKNKPPTT